MWWLCKHLQPHIVVESPRGVYMVHAIGPPGAPDGVYPERSTPKAVTGYPADAPTEDQMIVTPRQNETETSWKRRNRIAQNVEKWGWRVWCSECSIEGRHKPSSGPLREAACARCGGRLSRGIAGTVCR